MDEGTLGFFNHLTLSRAQFGITAISHILYPVLTIGLSLFLVIMEGLWLKTKNVVYYHHVRFWSVLFLLNFAVGVATGIPMEFQFGTNWSPFSQAGGDVFGHLLGFEAAMSFMLEASFLGVMIFAWHRVPKSIHFLSTVMVCFGAFLSGFWIMAANSWMQAPTGGFMQEGKFAVTSQYYAIMNPSTAYSVSHMIVACVEISLFVVGAVSAGYILKKRHVDFFTKSFKMAVLFSILITPLQIFLGDGLGRFGYYFQPSKLAAMEAHWDTNERGKGAPWHIIAWPQADKERNLFEINIPYGLSIISARSPTGLVIGMRDFAKEDRPPVWPPFLGFRLMIFMGFGFFFLMLWTIWKWLAGELDPDRIGRQKWLLYLWIAAAPLSYITMEAGWVVREVGRQPWTMFGLVRTAHSVSQLPDAVVGGSLATFVIFYLILPVLFLIFAYRILARGPLFKDPAN